MADALLSTSIAALKSKILSDITTASIADVASLARSAKNIGLGDDTDIETAFNSRVNSLISGASAAEIKILGTAIKQLKNDPTQSSLITNSDDITEGSINLFHTQARVNNELSSVTTDIVPDGDVNRNLGSSANKFNTVHAATVTGLNAPINNNDAATKSYVDSNVSNFDPAAVSQSIIPDTNEAYDLGSATNKFRDLYLSSNTLYLGDTTFSSDDILNFDLSVTPETLEIQVDDPTAGHGTAWQWTWTQSALPFARLAITNSPQTVVPLYLEGTYQINNFAHTVHGSMTQRHDFKLKWIEGAGDDNLVPWVTTSIVNDSHPDINGGTAQDVQRLAVSVPSSITLPTLVAPSVSYDVTSTTGAYVFSGTASGNNPEIGPFYRGGTYTVNINATGHPFYFTTDNGTNFSVGTYFGEWTSGVTGSRNETGTITFVVPSNAPDILYYQCGNHSNMRGIIRVKDLAVETNANGNYLIYGQHNQEGHVQTIELRPLPTLTSQMCLVYDSSTNKFVPQDLATYVENTPSFENKIKEVAGTATLIAPDGTSLVASVNIYSDATYLPAVGNTVGDIAFVEDTQKLYIYKTTGWIETVANADLTGLATEAYVQNYVANNVSGGNVVEYTATSNTSVNDVVMLNSNGTVSKIDVVTYNAIPDRGTGDITTTNDTNAGNYRGYGAHFHDTSDKIAALYYSGSGLKSLIVSINGSSVTTGTTYSHGGGTSARIFADQYDSSKVIILNTDGTNLTYQTGSVLGTAITWDAVSTTSLTLPNPCYIHYNHGDSSDGSMVFDVAYGALKVKRFTWDGTNMSAGNEIDLGTTGLSAYLMFDPSTSGRFATRQGGVLIGGLIDWTLETATVGGTAPINGGNHTSTSGGTHLLDFNPLTGDIVVAAQNQSGDGYAFTLQSFSMDNTYTFTGLGATVVAAGANTTVQFARDLRFIPNSQNFVMTSTGGNQQDETYYKVYSVNGNGFVQKHSVRVEQYASLMFSTSVNHSRKGQYTLHGVRRQPDSTWKYYNEVIFGQTEYVESNLDASKVHGIAATAGTTIDVTVENGIHSGLSGLTAGSKYYVLEDGTLSTTPDSKQAKIGLAMTSTSLALDFTDELTDASLATYATKSYVATQVANLVDSAPATLDTLNELAAALGDDANFSTTITNSLANKADTSSLAAVATSGNYNDLSNTPTIPTVPSTTANVLSGATHSLDLSENYFKIDLSSNTTFSTTNHPTNGEWYEGKIEITGNASQLTHNMVVDPGGITNWRNAKQVSRPFYVLGSEIYGFFAVSPDGYYAITGSYVGTGDYRFIIFQMSTPFDIGSYTGNYSSPNVFSTLGLNQRGNVYFVNNTTLQLATNHVIDITTGNITSNSSYGTLPGNDDNNNMIGNWTSDGTKYINIDTSPTLNTWKLYTATTPFRANTLTLTQTYSAGTVTNTTSAFGGNKGIWISDDGLNVYVAGYSTGSTTTSWQMMKYTLSTAFDLSSAVYDQVYYTDTVGSLFHGRFGDNGNVFLTPRHVGGSGMRSFENLATPPVLNTTTWPGSWKWEGGSSPAATENNEVDIVNFVTTDGGGTFNAWLEKDSDKPAGFDGQYSSLTGAPTLATVATSGSYNDLTNTPTIPSLTGYATETYVDTSVANLVDSAPTTLDTLNELAAALGDDPNFATTITNQIASKANAYSTVTVTASGGYFYIDGIQQATLSFEPGRTYRFDQSDASNGSHPLRFSTTSDGTHGSGVEYTVGVTTNGTAGSAGAYTEIAITHATPDLYYYCTNHSGMGAGSVVGNFSGSYSDLTGTPTPYSDSMVDTHLNQSSASTGQVLSWNGSDYSWADVAGGATTSDTAPTSPSAGEFWFKSDSADLYLYYTDADSSQWIQVGGAAASTTTGSSSSSSTTPFTKFYLSASQPGSTVSSSSYLGQNVGTWYEATFANAANTAGLSPDSSDRDPTLTGITFSGDKFSGFVQNGTYEISVQPEVYERNSTAGQRYHGWEASTGTFSSAGWLSPGTGSFNINGVTVPDSIIVTFEDATPANNWVRYILESDQSGDYWIGQAILTIKKIG